MTCISRAELNLDMERLHIQIDDFCLAPGNRPFRFSRDLLFAVFVLAMQAAA
ncbi:MAG: hypothetical protein ACRDSH_18235 [Pseudonocardiaceae bacterium]